MEPRPPRSVISVSCLLKSPLKSDANFSSYFANKQTGGGSAAGNNAVGTEAAAR